MQQVLRNLSRSHLPAGEAANFPKAGEAASFPKAGEAANFPS